MPVNEPWSRWAGLSLHDRGRQRGQLILDAAFDLVAEQGDLDAVTIRAVTARSGVHRRYFAESFESRDALICTMFDTAVSGMTLAGLAALKSAAPTTTDQRLRTVIHSALSYCARNSAHAQVIFAALDEPGLRTHWQEAMVSFRPLIARPTPEGAAPSVKDAVIATFLEGAIVEFGKRWVAGEFGENVDDATDASATAILELMKLNQSIHGADERAASLWRTVIAQ